ncbi:MAG: helix-turn-helix domain-containing protein [Chlamydiales bacterium]|nr:helix-turn-helix domain-containing protein [Chlamydiales bacterium]
MAVENITNNRWFSVDEIAQHLGVKRDTVYKWIEEKQMPAHKVGRLWKFQKIQVDVWVQSGRADQSKQAHKDTL